jgi:hypothetical protein
MTLLIPRIRRRSRFMFDWNADDCLLAPDATAGVAQMLAPLTGQAATFTRASIKYAPDENGIYGIVPKGLPAFAWSLDPVSGLMVPGVRLEGARMNYCLWNRDLTNAAWTKSNITAAKDQVGVDGVANSASSLLATAGNATCKQAITLGSAAYCQSAFVKRVVGTGVVDMTLDNGSTWTAITVTSAWTRVTIPTQTLANPTVGFRLVTNTDKIAVDFSQLEAGTFPSSPMATTTVAVTRSADALSFAYNGLPGPTTVYVKHTLPTGFAAAAHVFALTNSSIANPILFQRYESAATIRNYYHNGVTSVEQSVATGAVADDTIESMTQLSDTGTVTAKVSVNGGATATVGPSAAPSSGPALAAAWAAPTMLAIGFLPTQAFELYSTVQSVRIG